MIFRYPGGKTKLLEPIKRYLYPLLKNSNSFYEPFVGGGSVICEVARDFPDIKLFGNDKDIYIYAFWKMLADDKQADIDRFYALINQKPTVKLFKRMREEQIPKGIVERAYYAVFFNRTAFSGILTSGPIGGYGQTSKYKIGCRYNAARIIKEFEALRVLFKDRFHMSNDDCGQYIINVPGPLYLDPPYYVKGKDLYPTHMNDRQHRDLADILRSRTNWVMSYDICTEIDSLYSWAQRIPLDARYSITDRKKNWVAKKEYIILPK